MSKPISMTALLATVIFAAACGSSHDGSGMGGTSGTGGAGGTSGTGGTSGNGGTGGTSGAAVYPPCVSDGNQLAVGPIGAVQLCAPSGFPFAQEAFVHSNVCGGICPIASPAGTTIRLSQPQAGTLCLSGSTPGDATSLALSFTVYSTDMLSLYHQNVISRLNASAKGITELRFTIDAPPAGGVTLSADTGHSDVCDNHNCVTTFTLPTIVTASGTTTVALADFGSNPPQTFDSRALDGIEFNAGPGAIDFCVHDFQFLDAAGNVVSP